MTFLELAKSRYSVRAYKPDALSEEVLNQILEAGRVAPTACNYQPQRIYVVRTEENRKKLAEVSPCTFDAPVILVVCYDKERDAKSRLMPGYTFGEMDASIVCTHMMLQAWDLGVGSCWVGMFNDEQVAKALNLPDNVHVAALLPMGYPAENAQPLPLHSQFRDFADTVSEI